MAAKTEKATARRSDADIKRDVEDALRRDDRIPDDKITVTLRDGFLTLEGTVDWHTQRDAAETEAKSVLGVRAVDNKIEVHPGVGSPRESW
jgi:osmotically-inducible protein OsmY